MTLYSLAEAPVLYNPLPAPLIVTYEEAAQILGGGRSLSTRHIERLVLAKKLRKVGKGRARRIVYASILEYIERASNGKA
jgi:excisionase family DNA binding protein